MATASSAPAWWNYVPLRIAIIVIICLVAVLAAVVATAVVVFTRARTRALASLAPKSVDIEAAQKVSLTPPQYLDPTRLDLVKVPELTRHIPHTYTSKVYSSRVSVRSSSRRSSGFWSHAGDIRHVSEDDVANLAAPAVVPVHGSSQIRHLEADPHELYLDAPSPSVSPTPTRSFKSRLSSTRNLRHDDASHSSHSSHSDNIGATNFLSDRPPDEAMASLRRPSLSSPSIRRSGMAQTSSMDSIPMAVLDHDGNPDESFSIDVAESSSEVTPSHTPIPRHSTPKPVAVSRMAPLEPIASPFVTPEQTHFGSTATRARSTRSSPLVTPDQENFPFVAHSSPSDQPSPATEHSLFSTSPASASTSWDHPSAASDSKPVKLPELVDLESPTLASTLASTPEISTHIYSVERVVVADVGRPRRSAELDESVEVVYGEAVTTDGYNFDSFDNVSRTKPELVLPSPEALTFADVFVDFASTPAEFGDKNYFETLPADVLSVSFGSRSKGSLTSSSSTDSDSREFYHSVNSYPAAIQEYFKDFSSVGPPVYGDKHQSIDAGQHPYDLELEIIGSFY